MLAVFLKYKRVYGFFHLEPLKAKIEVFLVSPKKGLREWLQFIEWFKIERIDSVHSYWFLDSKTTFFRRCL